jgi:hypothetical protein
MATALAMGLRAEDPEVAARKKEQAAQQQEDDLESRRQRRAGKQSAGVADAGGAGAAGAAASAASASPPPPEEHQRRRPRSRFVRRLMSRLGGSSGSVRAARHRRVQCAARPPGSHAPRQPHLSRTGVAQLPRRSTDRAHAAAIRRRPPPAARRRRGEAATGQEFPGAARPPAARSAARSPRWAAG